MKIKSKLLCFTLSLLVLISTTGFKAKDEPKIDQSLLKNDFYAAVNKEWLSTAKIKDGALSSDADDEIDDSINAFKKDLFKDLLKRKNTLKDGSTEKKIIDFYESFLDTKNRNKDGIKPVQSFLDQIRSVESITELNTLFADDKFNIYNPIYNLYISTDYKNSSKNILYMNPTPLTFGNSDEYANPSEQTKFLETEYIKYFTKILKLSGYSEDEAKRKIENTFKFEEMIAPHIMGLKESTTNSDIFNWTYNICSVNDLDKLAPNLNFPSIMKSLGYDKSEKIILKEPKWLSNLNSIYTDKNLDLIKDLIELTIISDAAPYISDDFVKAGKELSQATLGVQGEAPLEEQAMNLTEAIFSEEIGKLYVEKHFTAENKKDVENLTKKVIASYKKILSNTDVFGEETRKNAIKKLDSLKFEIGYPDNWRDYGNFEIKSYQSGGSLYGNLLNFTYSNKAYVYDTLNNSPISAWAAMPPQTVNALYSPTSNTMLFPAGILQPPYYDPNQSVEENLGAIGSVIAHEISHAFDNNGSQFDQIGNLRNWWTKNDLEKFTERATKVRDFYSKIEYLPGHFVNGDLKLGENMADIAAIQCTLSILAEMENPNYKAYFESWAKSWREISTPEYDLNHLLTNTHSPHKLRTNAVLQQFEKFHETYDIKPGDKMYVAPEERIKIW